MLLFFQIILIIILFIFFGVIIFSIPATLSLQKGIRPGIEKLTIDDAINNFREQNIQGFELVEQTRKLIITRMQYCRRNSFDSYKKAFKRGYGYCMQQAYAMEYILNRLGIEAHVVQSLKCKLFDGRISGHAWVRVFHEGISKDIDVTYLDLVSDKITFKPISKVTKFSPLFRFIALWGSSAVNAYRFYTTKKDYQA